MTSSNANNLVMNQPTFSGPGGNVTVASGPASLVVNDIYAFFFRRQFASGGQGRLFGGFTSHSQGLVGGDATLPQWIAYAKQKGFFDRLFYYPVDEPGSNGAQWQTFTSESHVLHGVSLTVAAGQVVNRISVDEHTRQLARIALDRMLSLR